MKDLKEPIPSDVSSLPAWLKPVWVKLRDTFLVGAFLAGILIPTMNWYRDTFPEPIPATSDQLDVQSKDIRHQLETTQDIVHAAFQAYTDSLAMVRADVEETMAKPILNNIIELKRQVQQLQRGQVTTGLAIEEQRQNAEATTQELLERIADRPVDHNTEVLQQIQLQLNEIREQLPPPRKKSKSTF